MVGAERILSAILLGLAAVLSLVSTRGFEQPPASVEDASPWHALIVVRFVVVVAVKKREHQLIHTHFADDELRF